MYRFSADLSSSTALDSYVAELGNDISYDKRYDLLSTAFFHAGFQLEPSATPSTDESLLTHRSLSSSRFLKTILARHAYGPLVLKIFIKPDVSLSLRPIQQRLKRESEGWMIGIMD